MLGSRPAGEVGVRLQVLLQVNIKTRSLLKTPFYNRPLLLVDKSISHGFIHSRQKRNGRMVSDANLPKE